MCDIGPNNCILICFEWAYLCDNCTTYCILRESYNLISQLHTQIMYNWPRILRASFAVSWFLDVNSLKWTAIELYIIWTAAVEKASYSPKLLITLFNSKQCIHVETKSNIIYFSGLIPDYKIIFRIIWSSPTLN